MSALFSLHNPTTTTLFRHRSLIKDFEKSTKLKIDVLRLGNFRQLLGKPLVQPEVINGSLINYGNKINPLNFQPGATQSHHSVWFSQPKNYSQSLEEDKIIRDFIEKYAEKKRRMYSSKNKFVGGIARIFIQKRIDLTEIIIYMGPKLFIGNRPGEIEELQGYLQKELNCVHRKVKIAITKTAKTYGNANILAEWLSIKIKDGVSCRKAMKKAIELAEQEDIKGIQVQIKGRIDGKEIARVEWFREGRVPLQTIGAKIDYCAHKVQTKSGVLGIKIWILTDEE